MFFGYDVRQVIYLLCFTISMLFLLSITVMANPTIEIDTQRRTLYYIDMEKKHIKLYPIAVGRPGLQWKGQTYVSRKAKWPSWTPTHSMRKRDASLPKHVAGGSSNPLGARALYLGTSALRIHGTNQPSSIGKAVSSGCFRMRNSDVIELYELVDKGVKVTVK